MKKNAENVLTPDEMGRIRNVDRLLPSQSILCKHFSGTQEDFFSRLESLIHSVLPVEKVEDKWDIALKPGVTYASLGSELSTLFFYQLLIRLGGIKQVLELGTYIGVSTLFLAEAVGEKGHVTTVELGEEFYGIARENFARNKLQGRIEAICGGAFETLAQLGKQGKKYDMVLVDAAKERYGDMLEPALACLNPGGLLVVDDIFANGDTLNVSPALQKGQGVQALLERITKVADLQSKVILPLGNGVLLAYKADSKNR
jgi:caffeoyl-CoA O-methyltransferase